MNPSEPMVQKVFFDPFFGLFGPIIYIKNSNFQKVICEVHLRWFWPYKVRIASLWFPYGGRKWSQHIFLGHKKLNGFKSMLNLGED